MVLEPHKHLDSIQQLSRVGDAGPILQIELLKGRVIGHKWVRVFAWFCGLMKQNPPDAEWLLVWRLDETLER